MTWFFFTMMNHNSFFFLYTHAHTHTQINRPTTEKKSLFFSLLLDDLYTYTFNLTVIDSRLQRKVSDDLILGVFMSGFRLCWFLHACRSCPTRAGLLSRIKADAISATRDADLSQCLVPERQQEEKNKRQWGHFLKNIQLKQDNNTLLVWIKSQHNSSNNHLFTFMSLLRRHECV